MQYAKVVAAVASNDTVIDAALNSDEDVAFQSVESATKDAFTHVTDASNELTNRFWMNQDNVQNKVYHSIFHEIMRKVNPPYDEVDLIAKMQVDLENDFSQLCGVYYRDLDEVLHIFFKSINAETTRNLDGLNSSLRRTLNFIYRAELSRDEEQRDRFRTLITQYEAYLRKLYFLREGHELEDSGSGDGLVNVVRQFPMLQKLYTDLHFPRRGEPLDVRYSNFRQFYDMVYNWRNNDSHASPLLPENELPAAIHIIVAMYVYAAMISVSEIEENLDDYPEDNSPRIDQAAENK